MGSCFLVFFGFFETTEKQIHTQHIARIVCVREKGNRMRVVPLDDGIRERMWLLAGVSRPRGHMPLFGRAQNPLLALGTLCAFSVEKCDKREKKYDTRQLRNLWYDVCKGAGIKGHPHAARHFVVHQLFLAGNSIQAWHN